MKKNIFLFYIFIFLFINIIESKAKWGKGEVKFNRGTLEHFISYLYGSGSVNKSYRAQPLLFVVSEDGSMSHFFYCPYVEGCIDDKSIQKKAESACEKNSIGTPCFTFAIKRRIVWKNGGPKIKIKTKDLKSPYIIAKKMKEAGFFDGDISQLSGIDMKTGKIDDTITITGEKRNLNTDNSSSSNEKSTDIVEQLESLKKLYLSGVLSKEEFTKAKNKLLNQ